MKRRALGRGAAPHSVLELSPQRQVVLTFLDLSSWDHYMFAILDVDVTCARGLIEGFEARTGESLSFTGFLTHCLARAVGEEPTVQAYLKGRKRLVMFDDVDVGLMVERGTGGARAPVGYVVRRANRKDVLEIHREIRTVQVAPPRTAAEIPAWLRVMPHLPGPIGGALVSLVRAAKRHDPARMWVPMAGTVAVTAVGMFGSGSGWGVAAPDGHTLCLIVGGIAAKPAVVEGRVEVRDMLSLTVAFDHQVVDGAPAARFVGRLKELIESGHGLDHLDEGEVKEVNRSGTEGERPPGVDPR